MSYYSDRDRPRGLRRLYVGNLNRYVRERDLDRMFSKLGRVRDLELMSSFAFIEYDDPRDAEDAIREFHGTRLEGDRIIVEFAKSRRGYDNRRTDRFGERCYNCGEIGHISRECSLPKGSGERAMRFEENRCFECGQPGHRARECPERGGAAAGGAAPGDASSSRRRSRSRSPSRRRERSRSPRPRSRSPRPRSRSPRARSRSRSRSRSPGRHSRRYSGEREDRSRYEEDEQRYEGNGSGNTGDNF